MQLKAKKFVIEMSIEMNEIYKLILKAKYVEKIIGNVIGPDRISKYINLKGIPITTSGVQHRINKLDKLGLIRKNKVTQEGIEHIRKFFDPVTDDHIFNLITKERYKGSINRTKQILKVIELCEDIPVSTRQIGKALRINTKSIRLRLKKFEKLELVQFVCNAGWVLTKKGKLLASKMNTEIKHSSIAYLKEVIRRRSYYPIAFNDWKKIISRGVIQEMKNDNVFYHWYNQPSNTRLLINLKVLQQVINKLKIKLNIKSDRGLSLRLGMHEKAIGCYRRGEYSPSIKTLKIFCEKLKISYDELEQIGLFKHNFPIRLNTQEMLQLRTHTLNEGSLTTHGITYHNLDPILLKIFCDCIRKIDGNVSLPNLGNESDIYVTTDSITARCVTSLDLPTGSHSINNPRLHPLQLNKKQFIKHMQITLAEEGIIHLRIQRKTNNKFYVDLVLGISRNVDITDLLPKDIIKNLPLRKTLFTKLPPYIQNLLIKKRCKLLDDEVSTFYKIFLSNIPMDKLPMPKPRTIHKTLDNKITLSWVWQIWSKEAIDIFYEKIGILEGTWSQQKFEILYNVWKKFRSKPLTKYQVNKINLIKEKFTGHAPTSEWIREKIKECFPQINLNQNNWKNFFKSRR